MHDDADANANAYDNADDDVGHFVLCPVDIDLETRGGERDEIVDAAFSSSLLKFIWLGKDGEGWSGIL